MAQKDEDGVQDQGSLDEPQKSTKSKAKDVDDWDPDNPVDRVHDVPLKKGKEVVDEESLDPTQNESRPAEQV